MMNREVYSSRRRKVDGRKGCRVNECRRMGSTRA